MQKPGNPKGSWKSLVPAALVVAFVLSWAAQYAFERNKDLVNERSQLGRDLFTVHSILIERLNDDREFLLHLAEDIGLGNLGANGAQDRGSRYAEEHAEVLAIVRVDETGSVRWVAPPNLNEAQIGREIMRPESRRAERKARDEGRPVFGEPYSALGGDSAFQLFVPVMKDGRFIGTLCAVYSLPEIVNDIVGAWAGDRYRVTVVDKTGGILAQASEPGRDADERLTGAVFLEPVGGDVMLHFTAHKNRPNWHLIALLTLSIVLGAGAAHGAWVQRREINQRRLAEEGLKRSERRFRRIFDLGLIGIAESSPEKGWVRVNDHLCHMLGYTREELLSLSWADLTHPDDRDMDDRQFKRVMAGEIDGYSLEKRYLHKNGTVVPAILSVRCQRSDAGTVDYFITFIQDITDRKQAETQIRHMASHDALTGLPNRTLGFDRLSSAMARARRNNTKAALLFIDLDGFKEVNDAFGHAAGDDLLADNAVRLESCIRETDTVARFGGDEFIIVLTDLEDDGPATMVAAKVLAALSRSFIIAGEPIDIERTPTGASIGIALYPDHGNTPEDLVKAADNAMYEAKRRGKNTYQIAAAGGKSGAAA